MGSAESHYNSAPDKGNDQCHQTVHDVSLHAKDNVSHSPGHADTNKSTNGEEVLHLLDQSSNKILLGLEGFIDGCCCVERCDYQASEEQQDADSHDGGYKAPDQGNYNEFFHEEDIVSVHGSHEEIGSQRAELDKATNNKTNDATVAAGPLHRCLLCANIFLVGAHCCLDTKKRLINFGGNSLIVHFRDVLCGWIVRCHFALSYVLCLMSKKIVKRRSLLLGSLVVKL